MESFSTAKSLEMIIADEEFSIILQIVPFFLLLYSRKFYSEVIKEDILGANIRCEY